MLGRLTDMVNLNIEKEGDLSLITRLNPVRVSPDGSFVFIGLLVAIFPFTGLAQTSSEDATETSINLLLGAAVRSRSLR